jgi:hypothetical protein
VKRATADPTHPHEPKAETASPPAPAPPDAIPEARGTLVEQLWDRLKTGKPMLHALASRHHRTEVEPDRLRIQFLSDQ